MGGRDNRGGAARHSSAPSAAVVCAALAVVLAACESQPGAAVRPVPSSAAGLDTASASRRSSSFLPSRLEELSEHEEAKARELERSLASLPGVSDARVHLVLPTPAPLLGDAPAQQGKASVLLQYRGPRAPLENSDVQRLVAGGTRGIEPEHVQVVLQSALVAPPPPPPATPEFVRVGPISVEKGSASVARVVLGVAAGTGITLTAVLVGMWLTLRRRGESPRPASNASLGG